MVLSLLMVQKLPPGVTLRTNSDDSRSVVTESDQDRWLLIQRKEQLLGELRSINSRIQMNGFRLHKEDRKHMEVPQLIIHEAETNNQQSVELKGTSLQSVIENQQRLHQEKMQGNLRYIRSREQRKLQKLCGVSPWYTNLIEFFLEWSRRKRGSQVPLGTQETTTTVPSVTTSNGSSGLQVSVTKELEFESMLCHHCDHSLVGHRYVLRDDHTYCVRCYETGAGLRQTQDVGRHEMEKGIL